eukprot:21413-Eustigmatos_ZCMA.PRE.1
MSIDRNSRALARFSPCRASSPSRARAAYTSFGTDDPYRTRDVRAKSQQTLLVPNATRTSLIDLQKTWRKYVHLNAACTLMA